MLSDRDLWRILLTAPHTQPPEEWIATAKAALSSGPGDTYGTDDYIDLFCRAIVIAFEYYENYARQNDVFYNGALRCESAVSIFEGAVIASGMQSWHVFSSDYSIIDLAKSQSLIQVRTVAGLWEHDGDYCELTYPGHKRGEIESSPTLPVAGEKERIAPWKMAQRISTAASANAQATGGQGGDGGHSLSQSAPI
ncbi:MAG: hypothetical protein LUG50_04070 [Planctomycetaceae bacterium]|nr:hypothetical protein [Planctomycetaceae bacterium]